MRKMLYKLYMYVACLSYEHMIERETGTQQPHNRNCDEHKQKQNKKKMVAVLALASVTLTTMTNSQSPQVNHQIKS